MFHESNNMLKNTSITLCLLFFSSFICANDVPSSVETYNQLNDTIQRNGFFTPKLLSHYYKSIQLSQCEAIKPPIAYLKEEKDSLPRHLYPFFSHDKLAPKFFCIPGHLAKHLASKYYSSNLLTDLSHAALNPSENKNNRTLNSLAFPTKQETEQKPASINTKPTSPSEDCEKTTKGSSKSKWVPSSQPTVLEGDTTEDQKPYIGRHREVSLKTSTSTSTPNLPLLPYQTKENSKAERKKPDKVGKNARKKLKRQKEKELKQLKITTIDNIIKHLDPITESKSNSITKQKLLDYLNNNRNLLNFSPNNHSMIIDPATIEPLIYIDEAITKLSQNEHNTEKVTLLTNIKEEYKNNANKFEGNSEKLQDYYKIYLSLLIK